MIQEDIIKMGDENMHYTHVWHCQRTILSNKKSDVD